MLTSEARGDETIGRHDAGPIKTNKGHTVNSLNFRDDLNLSGVVDKPDKAGSPG